MKHEWYEWTEAGTPVVRTYESGKVIAERLATAADRKAMIDGRMRCDEANDPGRKAWLKHGLDNG